MDSIALMVGFSLAIGVGLVANRILSIAYETGRRFSRAAKHGRLYSLGVSGSGQKKEKFTEDLILGLPPIPWGNLYAGSMLVGLILFFIVGSSIPGTRLGLLGLPILVWLAKRYLIGQHKRFLVGEVRQFLIDLRLHLSLQGSLLLALESIARNSGQTSVIDRTLRRRMAGGSASNGLEVLERIAEDLKSSHLKKAVQRIQAAQQAGGILDVDLAISNAINEMSEEIGYQADEQMQRLPLRITLLAMPFLLGPIVILLFYPLVDRILKTLSGVGVGGGF
jgi:hypothetical protein